MSDPDDISYLFIKINDRTRRLERYRLAKKRVDHCDVTKAGKATADSGRTPNPNRTLNRTLTLTRLGSNPRTV